MARIAIDKNGNQAVGKLLGVTDQVEFNFINLDVSCLGIYLRGTFLGGDVVPHDGINLSFINPPTRVCNPATGVPTDISYSSPGMYFYLILQDTIFLDLTGGAGGTDIDFTIFMPARFMYNDTGFFGAAV